MRPSFRHSGERYRESRDVVLEFSQDLDSSPVFWDLDLDLRPVDSDLDLDLRPVDLRLGLDTSGLEPNFPLA